MKKIELAIELGLITIEDIEKYLESKGQEIIESNHLQILEESFRNHPG